MNIFKISLRIIIALILVYILILCFIKVKDYNNQLNEINHYDLTAENQVSIDEINQFLNKHDVDYELNYNDNLTAIAASLPYYSSFEKFLNIAHYHRTKIENDTEATISDIENYYQSLKPQEQVQFDQYLNELVAELVGGQDEE